VPAPTARLVRAGSAAALAEAVVAPVPAEAAAWVDPDDEVLIVSREIPADGRSRARIGGRLAPVSALDEVLGRFVEVHAQHEHVRLQRAEVQRRLLDRYAGERHARTLAAYRRTHGQWHELVERRERLAADARERARELDRLRFEVAEIDRAELDAEGDGSLDREVDRLAHADQLRTAAATAAAALGSDGCPGTGRGGRRRVAAPRGRRPGARRAAGTVDGRERGADRARPGHPWVRRGGGGRSGAAGRPQRAQTARVRPVPQVRGGRPGRARLRRRGQGPPGRAGT
jgi:hypothetical protein